jgi:hypothetical protein
MSAQRNIIIIAFFVKFYNFVMLTYLGKLRQTDNRWKHMAGGHTVSAASAPPSPHAGQSMTSLIGTVAR